jgi:hypothetical protein
MDGALIETVGLGYPVLVTLKTELKERFKKSTTVNMNEYAMFSCRRRTLLALEINRTADEDVGLDSSRVLKSIVAVVPSSLRVQCCCRICIDEFCPEIEAARENAAHVLMVVGPEIVICRSGYAIHKDPDCLNPELHTQLYAPTVFMHV